MLETLTKELRPGITVTVQEHSNASYYAQLRLIERIKKPDDDEELQEFRYRFAIIATRTAQVSGIDPFAIASGSTDEEIEAEFQRYMALPEKLATDWLNLTLAVGKSAEKN